mgnify:FL=1
MPISISLEKARDLTKSRLREERVLLLSEQDVAFQRALETGEDTSAIVAEKQRLRDITKTADEVSEATEAETLEALANLSCQK